MAALPIDHLVTFALLIYQLLKIIANTPDLKSDVKINSCFYTLSIDHLVTFALNI